MDAISNAVDPLHWNIPTLNDYVGTCILDDWDLAPGSVIKTSDLCLHVQTNQVLWIVFFVYTLTYGSLSRTWDVGSFLTNV